MILWDEVEQPKVTVTEINSELVQSRHRANWWITKRVAIGAAWLVGLVWLAWVVGE